MAGSRSLPAPRGLLAARHRFGVACVPALRCAIFNLLIIVADSVIEDARVCAGTHALFKIPHTRKHTHARANTKVCFVDAAADAVDTGEPRRAHNETRIIIIIRFRLNEYAHVCPFPLVSLSSSSSRILLPEFSGAARLVVSSIVLYTYAHTKRTKKKHTHFIVCVCARACS